MAGLIPTAFEFVPTAILAALFFLLVLYLKFTHQLSMRTIGSDICLGAFFIQMTMLAVPVWMSDEISINVPGQASAFILIFILWIITIWLLKQRKISRKYTTGFYNKIINFLNEQRNIRELLTYVLGAFALTLSLMMMLNVIEFELAEFRNQTAQLALAAFTSIALGYAGYNVYKYLQNEQFSQQFLRFSSEITRDNVLLTIQTSGPQMHDRDPVQPVVDIIRGSIMKGVLGPSLFGLKILTDSCMELLTTSGMRQQNLNRVTSHFVGHIDDIYKVAMRMDEDEVAIKSIRSMSEIGKVAVSMGLETPTEDILVKLFEHHDMLQSKEFQILKLTIANAISQIGSESAAHGFQSPALKASNMLGRIGASAVREKDRSMLKEIITVLFIIGEESTVNLLESSVKQTALKLRDIGTLVVQMDMPDATLYILTNLEELGLAAASKKLELATEQIIWSIKDIGVANGYQHNEYGINAAVSALASVGLESSQQKMDDTVDQALWSLKEVSIYPISEELGDSMIKSAQSFARMAKSENDKVDRTIQDIGQYFGSDESGRFKKFQEQYTLARNRTGVK